MKNYVKLGFLTRSSVLFLLNRVKNRLPKIGEVFFDKFYYLFYKKADSYEEERVETISSEDKIIIEELAKDKKVIFLLNLDKNLSDIVIPLIGKAPVIDLDPALQRMYKEQGIDPYLWNITNEKGHWNIPAHKVVGNEIAKYMLETLNSKQ